MEKYLQQLTKDELIQSVKESIQEKESLKYLLKSMSGISWEFDLLSNKFNYVSENAKKVLGYELDEWNDFESWEEKIYHEDRNEASSYCANETKKGENHFMEYRMVKKTGEVIWILDVISLGKDEESNPVKLYGFILDIDKSKRAQLDVEKRHKYLQTLIDGVLDPVMVIKEDYSVDLMNEVVHKKIKGKVFVDPSSPKCYEISHHRTTPCDGKDHDCPLKSVLESKKITTVVHNHKELNGSDKFVELKASPLLDEQNKCIGIIESARDITSYIKLTKELEKKTRELNHQANHDHLTGLPNRALFMDRFEEAIKDAIRDKSIVALFFIDLDYFKEINDTYGHSIGDKVLQEVSKKVSSSLRVNDTLSRLGGDEFTVIMKNITKVSDVELLAEKLTDILSKPFIIDKKSFIISASIGVSLYPDNGSTPENLLKLADNAMYKTKKNGKSNFSFHH